MDIAEIGGRILYYEDRAVIFEESSAGNEMYIIECGRVEISQPVSGRKATITVLEVGDFFGEMAIFTDAPRSATAVAVGETRLISFSMEEILQCMETDLQFTITLLQTLMSRLRDTTSTLRTLIGRVYELGDGVIDGFLPEKQPLRIGEILMGMGCLTKLQLERSLQKQEELRVLEHRHKLLGEIMVKSGIITGEQLRNALAEQRIRLHRQVQLTYSPQVKQRGY